MHSKVEDYFRAGARLVWVVYPKPRVIYAYAAPNEVKILSGGDTLAGGDALPDFSVPVAEIFSVLDE